MNYFLCFFSFANFQLRDLQFAFTQICGHSMPRGDSRWEMMFSGLFVMSGTVLFSGQPVTINFGWLSFTHFVLIFHFCDFPFFRRYCPNSLGRKERATIAEHRRQFRGDFFLIHGDCEHHPPHLDFCSGALWFQLVVAVFTLPPLKFFLI